MGLEIFACDQGSEDWYRCRMGVPTASEFATVLARGRDGGVSATRRTYMMKLAGEILTGEPMENYSNGYMERGKAMEDDARERYAFDRDAEPQLVGFVRNGRMGCSPDSLIAEDGGLEIKTKAPHLHIDVLIKGDDYFPPEHKAQTQGFLLVTGREWIDLAIYWPKLPLIVRRAYRDEPYMQNLKGEIDRFNDEIDAIVERVKRYGVQPAEAA
jgi:hypothetical protein